MLGIEFNNFMLIYTYIFTLIVYQCMCKSNYYDVAQETAANYVTLKIIILTSSIKRWIGCRLI